MRCPFLREAHVQSCQASPFRKQIVRSGNAADERCGSAAWRDCSAARELTEEHPSAGSCPFHAESLVQYCSAAPVTKFIPWSDQAFSRCGSESHRYCDLYLALARTSAPTAETGEPAPRSDDADGIPVPTWLWFAPSHTWLAVASDGVCHIGVDAFLARTLGGIDRVQFVTTKGLERPAAVLTVRDVDLTVSFPNPVFITGVNGALRADPARLARDPYGLGWLFEGIVRDRAVPSERPPEAHRRPPPRRRRHGVDAPRGAPSPRPRRSRLGADLRRPPRRRRRASRPRSHPDPPARGSAPPLPPSPLHRHRRREVLLKLPAPVSFAVGLVPALAAGWLLFPRLLYKTEAQPLPFNHKAHTEGGMGCTDCHAVGRERPLRRPSDHRGVRRLPRREGRQRGHQRARRAATSSRGARCRGSSTPASPTTSTSPTRRT